MFWYEDEVEQLENFSKTPENKNRVAFYGSSSFRLWDMLQKDFPHIPLINLGFGGSTLAACCWFFERVLIPLSPRSIVLYAGDNDLGDGRHPEEVFNHFQLMLYKIHEHFGDIPFTFISIKPSPARWNINDRIAYTNKLIYEAMQKRGGHLNFIDIYYPMLGNSGYPRKELYEPDGLHLSAQGYQLWKQIIEAHSDNIF